jgi:cytidine deaminase
MPESKMRLKLMKCVSATELIKQAASITKRRKLGENSAGSVGCALLSEKGRVYTGVCIDTGSSMGFCAEHNAIGNMVTAGESRIKMIAAVWKNEKGKIFVLHPCGRCREFMRQIDERNMEADIILGRNRIVKLKKLLPYKNDYSPV